MHNRSTAAVALILNAQTISAAAHGRNNTRNDVAVAWVEQAIASGCDPFIRQAPLSSGDHAGEWLLAISKGAALRSDFPGMPADEYFDEVFVILARLGRLCPDANLKPWHGNVLPDDSSPRGVGLRVKLARVALALDLANFYPASGVNAKTGQALEDGNRAFASIDNEILANICAFHSIPVDWVMFGSAEEIQAS
jgi:hypothetical protein